MITRDHPLPVAQQCKVLQLARSTAYYQPRPVATEALALMRQMDALHLDFPFAGARMLRDLLRNMGHRVGRRRVARLMRLMGIQAVYRKPKTTQRHPAHPVYPYLLRGLRINRPNQVWATDITYIPMARGFVYLCAVIDWATRRVLSWRLSNTLTADFCIEAMQEAVACHGAPEIVNTDQGSQLTSLEFTELLQEHGIRISMDGRGAWKDNVMIERLWRSVKYDEVYLYAYDSVRAAQAGLDRYFQLYNQRRPHSALDGRTPDMAYFGQLSELPWAA
jgi:putative transposase